MLDDMLDHLAHIREKPAWREMPASVRSQFAEPLPLEPQAADAVYRDFVRNVLPYPNGNIHPRFWGWVQGTGTPLAMLADMLASGLNPHMAGFNQAPALVEQQVLEWLRELMGMPPGTSGVLTSGATVANLIGLAVARHAKAGFDVRDEGLAGDHPRLVVYCSSEAHACAQRAVELLGLGRRSLRTIATNPEFRMDVSLLRRAIAENRERGLRPICVIGSAGTVNTGAVDDLKAIAQVCAEEDLWFHVDGAFGALARLSPELAHLVAGIESAGSMAFDLHKWMYLPFEVGCVLVRDAEMHRATFALKASYLPEATRGVTAGGLPFGDRGIDLTRGFKALKVWMSMKAHGVRAMAGLIEQNVRQAKYLARLIEREPDLELLAPVPLNVVCFRYAPKGTPEENLNGLNEEILLRLQEEGIAVPSATEIRGRYAIRVAIANHRSRLEDFDVLVRSVIRIGEQIRSEA
jgi:glutamate/tyrosine decarboxylase-like PLP-dependent enzyme